MAKHSLYHRTLAKYILHCSKMTSVTNQTTVKTLKAFSSKSIMHIIDLQGFKIWDNAFIFKEVAYIRITFPSVTSNTLHILPPMANRHLSIEDQRRVRCNAAFHGMVWESGSIPYTDFPMLLSDELKHSEVVYVKGSEKILWIKPYVHSECQIVDLDNYNCPSLTILKQNTDIRHTCNFPHRSQCAGLHVRILYEWMCKASWRELESLPS